MKGEIMPKRRINPEAPLTAAEKQKRFREKHRRDMTSDQEFNAIRKLKNEIKDIIDHLDRKDIYAIMPLMRFMYHTSNRLIAADIQIDLKDIELDLSSFPGAMHNRTDEENEDLEKYYEDVDLDDLEDFE
jgi:hypothetical protein